MRELTPKQTEGPFYPIPYQNSQTPIEIEKGDWDLTQRGDKKEEALGEKIILFGLLSNMRGEPIANALIEIWQACASGRYHHPNDTNPAPLDPHFYYWGRIKSNEKGEYRFKTVRPGSYPASPSWTRPAHIHLKVHKQGYESLTTQVYFKNDPHHLKDEVLQKLAPKERKKLIVDFGKSGEGQFNIVLP